MRRLYLFFAVMMLAAVVVAGLTPPQPVAATSKANLRGQEIFNNHSCAKCHGTNGVNGDRAPDLQTVRNRMDAAMIAKQIREGGKGMPPFGDQLSEKEVDDLVAYLRTKRKLIVPPPPAAAPVATKDPDGN